MVGGRLQHWSSRLSKGSCRLSFKKGRF